MQEEKTDHPYTAEYIRKYLDGELSDQDMQALEKAALDDPFLSDAIEGLEESRRHPISFESGMEDLKSRLSARTGERKSTKRLWIKFSGWAVAASVLLILGIGIFMVINTGKTTPPPDASAVAIDTPPQQKILKNDSAKPEDQGIVSVKPVKTENVTAGKKTKDLQKNTRQSTSEDTLANTVAAVSPVAADSLQRSEQSMALAKKEISAPVAVTRAVPDREEYSGADLKSIGSPSGNYIKGMVIDQKGAPVPFADVTLKGTNRHVFTDTAGFFKLYMKDPKLASLIFVQPAGYESVSAELTPDSNITNTIQVNLSLAAKHQKSAPAMRSSSIVGWDAFYSYIDSNKKINSTDSTRKGEEVISFVLHPDGKLSSFRIEKSVSPIHDSTILRLIETAPALKSQEKKKQRCVLQIRF